MASRWFIRLLALAFACPPLLCQSGPELSMTREDSENTGVLTLRGVDPEERWRLEVSTDLKKWTEVALFEPGEEGLQAKYTLPDLRSLYFRAARPLPPAVALVQASSLWKVSQPERYEFHLQSSYGFFSGSAKLTVEKGEVVEISEVKGDFFEQQDKMPIEGWLKVIEDAIKASAAIVNVTYDRQYGFPKSIFIDRSLQIADEERAIVISAFKPF